MADLPLPLQRRRAFTDSSAYLALLDENDRNHAAAIRLLARAFPSRRVVPIDARAVVYGYGSFHCVTQQEPA